MKSRFMAAFAAFFLTIALSAPAEARHHHYRHHRHHHHASDANGNAAYAKVHTALGLTATVIASAQAQFQGFIDEVERDQRDPESGELQKGNRIPDLGCKSRGHASFSKHHWGGACDFGQWARNRAVAFMFHVTAIAEKYGLIDGCTWEGVATRRHPFHGKDCGHIEVAGPNMARDNPSYRLVMQ